MQPTQALITRVQSGAAWVADTTVNTLTLNQWLRFKIVNSGNSNAYIYAFGGQASSAVTLTAKTGATTAVTANIVASCNQNVASKSASTLTITYDTNSSDVNGTYFRSLPLPANSFEEFNDSIILLGPGQTITLSAQFTLAATGIFHICWFEQSN